VNIFYLKVKSTNMNFKKLGFTLINEKKGIMKIKCPQGHIFSIPYRTLGNRKESEKCYLCIGRISKSNPIRDIKILVESWNYEVGNLKGYKNGNSKLKFICPKESEHIFTCTWNNFRRKRKCPFCDKKSVLRNKDEIYEWLSKSCDSWNLKLITSLEKFKGRKTKSQYKCLKCNKIFEDTVDGVNQRTKNNKCPWCSYGKSKKNGRRELKDIINEMEKGYKLNNISIVGKMINTRKHVELKCNKCNTVFFKNYNDSKKFGYRCNLCCKVYKNTYITNKLSQSKFNDNKVNRLFDLSYNWMKNQYKKQNGKCFYTNIQMNWSSDFIVGCSVDRLYNNLGHIKNNCVLTIPAINLLKNTMHHWDFIKWIEILSIHMLLTETTETTEDKKEIITSEDKVFIKKMINRPKYGTRHHINKHEIVYDDAYNLIKKQNGRCIISNLPMMWQANNIMSGSIDRINSQKGYIVSNIQLTNKHVNYMKGSVLDNNQCIFILKLLLENKDSINKINKDVLLSIEKKQLSNNKEELFVFKNLLLRIKFLKLLEKYNYKSFTSNDDVIIRENSTIKILCPMNHISNISYRSLCLSKKINCNKCESDTKYINNNTIDQLLLKNKSNLVRISDYPKSLYKAIKFKCTDEHIVYLKWLNVRIRPYCQICKKKTFKHNVLTEELRKFISDEYNGKLCSKFGGFKKAIQFQCIKGHTFKKSPICIGFKNSKNKNWCNECNN